MTGPQLTLSTKPLVPRAYRPWIECVPKWLETDKNGDALRGERLRLVFSACRGMLLLWNVDLAVPSCCAVISGGVCTGASVEGVSPATSTQFVVASCSAQYVARSHAVQSV